MEIMKGNERIENVDVSHYLKILTKIFGKILTKILQQDRKSPDAVEGKTNKTGNN